MEASQELEKEDLDYLYVIAPLVASWITTYVSGKTDSSGIDASWFTPNKTIFLIVWTFVYLVLGYILFKAARENDTEIFYMVVCLVGLICAWQYTYTSQGDYLRSMLLMVCILTVGTMILFGLMFSHMIEDDSPDSLGHWIVYLYVPVIIWFLINTLIFATSKPKTVKTQHVPFAGSPYLREA